MPNFTFSLYTTLKNTDLHALSAFEALTELLGQHQLVQLRRFQKWELTLSAASQSEATQQLDTVLKQSFILANTNKEHFYIDVLPELSHSPNRSSFLVQVTPKQPQDFQSTIDRIQQKTGVLFQHLTRSLLWEISIKDDGQPSSRQALLDQLVLTQSRKQGLLVNPLYETANVL
jgi:phosphoribosylformylglycinamidine (FGAM) synthase PurS component